MKTTDMELLAHDITHTYRGNGWAIVEFVDDEWVRLANPYQPESEKNRAYMAWRKKISITERREDSLDLNSKTVKVALSRDQLDRLATVRERLANGTHVCHHTHIIKASDKGECLTC